MVATNHSAIEQLLGSRSRTAEETEYIRYHAPRFGYLLALIGECLERLGASESAPIRYLDVGPHFLTALVAAQFGSRVRIDTLGWENPRLYDTNRVESHLAFDLNDASDRGKWVESEPHDLVLAAEIIEHLHTAPEHVFEFLRALIRPGGLLIIQTPNAAALRNRLLMAAGRNPFERIRLDDTNPGHFREYTLGELTEIARAAGFEVDQAAYVEYFKSQPLLRVAGLLVPGLRRGITLVLRRV
jgi:trans-aconitate methyltransferase